MKMLIRNIGYTSAVLATCTMFHLHGATDFGLASSTEMNEGTVIDSKSIPATSTPAVAVQESSQAKGFQNVVTRIEITNTLTENVSIACVKAGDHVRAVDFTDPQGNKLDPNNVYLTPKSRIYVHVYYHDWGGSCKYQQDNTLILKDKKTGWQIWLYTEYRDGKPKTCWDNLYKNVKEQVNKVTDTNTSEIRALGDYWYSPWGQGMSIRREILMTALYSYDFSVWKRPRHVKDEYYTVDLAKPTSKLPGE